jgi:hypothetical protein
MAISTFLLQVVRKINEKWWNLVTCHPLFFFCFATVGDDPQEDLAKFDYNLNIKVKINKTSFYIFGYIYEPCIEIWLLSFTIWLWEISKSTLF